MIRSRKAGYEYLWAGSGKSIKFISEEEYSPYLEINGDFLNEFRLENEIKINPFIRFNSIFSSFLEIFQETEEEKYKEIRKKFIHEALMCLREIDYVTGTTIIDIYCEKILKDIEGGVFGDELMEDFKKLTEEEKRIMVLLYYDKIVTGKESFDVFSFIFSYNFFVIWKSYPTTFILCIRLKCAIFTVCHFFPFSLKASYNLSIFFSYLLSYSRTIFIP